MDKIWDRNPSKSEKKHDHTEPTKVNAKKKCDWIKKQVEHF